MSSVRKKQLEKAKEGKPNVVRYEERKKKNSLPNRVNIKGSPLGQ